MILRDTHIGVRWVELEANPLPPAIIDPIETAAQLAVSAVTCWEVAWLTRRNRLQLKLSLPDWFDPALHGADVTFSAVDRAIAVRAANLSEHH